ncbi:MAG: hypothetical protein ABFS86_09370, partial [Planctomycetota bacterium]
LGLDLALRNQRVVGTAATVAILLLLAAMTWLRNEVWTSRVRMWEDVTAKSPAKARGFYNLGLACGDRSPPAMRAFREAVKLGHGSLSVQCLMEHRVARWGSFDDVRGDIRLLLDAGENQWAEIYLQDIRHDLGDDPRIVFEEARNYALWGAFSEAEECLGWAIELGFDDRTALLAEPAFRKLRHRPRFRQLVSKLE